MSQPDHTALLRGVEQQLAQHMRDMESLHRAVTDALAASTAVTAPDLGPSTDATRTLVTIGDTSAMQYSNRDASERQRRYIGDLLDAKHARTERAVVTMADASRAITVLKSMPDHSATAPAPTPPAPAPVGPVSVPAGLQEGTDYLPRAVFAVIPEGRYGVPNNSGSQTVFLRVVEQADKYSNQKVRKVQYKSSDSWITAQSYWPSGRVTGRREVHGTSVPDLLAQVMLDTGGCADRYARRFSECCNCGRELTDATSRWYSLGSDCIKRRADVVAYVEDLRGQWQPGMELRDWELDQQKKGA